MTRAILLTFFLSIGSVWATVLPEVPIKPEDFAKFETKVEAIAKKEKVPQQNLFYHYLLAARNLKKRFYFDWAIKYYNRALSLPVERNENRLKALVELTILLDQQKHYSQLSDTVAKLSSLAIELKFFVKHPQFQYLVDFYRVMGAQDLTSSVLEKDYKYFRETPYYDAILDHEFKLRMSKGMIKEAYSMFERHDHEIQSHDLRAAHDLLATVLEKKPSRWQCADSLREFPNGTSYSLQICRFLELKRKNQKVNVDGLLAQLQSKELDAAHFIPAVKLALK